MGPALLAAGSQGIKSFLLLFFKKEVLAFFRCGGGVRFAQPTLRVRAMPEAGGDDVHFFGIFPACRGFGVADAAEMGF